MSFRISEIEFKTKKIFFCSEWSENKNNIFTLITGKNGVGKTQLLTFIVRYYLDTLEQDNPQKISTPDRLIVHTNSKFDKFPYFYNRPPKQYKNLTSKSYRSYNNEIFTKLLFNNNLNKQAIYDTLTYLEYLPKIEYSATLATSYSGKSYLKETMEFFKKEVIKLGFDINIPAQRQPRSHKNLLSVLNRINENNISVDTDDIPKIFQLLKNKNLFNSDLNFIFDFKEGKINYGILSKSEYQLLSKYKLILFREIFFSKIDSESESITLSNLSSGQQSILNILIGISSVIQDNSLICIDEPEISLHPEWQEEIIEKLQNAFKDIYGCHFLIATHSPQVVSGLKSENGYILDLENNTLHKSIDYSKRSADYQLAKIFNSPGYNNEYILKICFHLLSIIKENIAPSQDDLKLLQDINKFKNNLKADDPSLYLIKQVQSFFG